MKNYIYFCLILLLSSSFVAKKTKLEFNLKEGKEYVHNFNTSLTINQEVMGQSMATKMNISTQIVYKVVSAKADHYDMNVRYNNITTEMELPQTTLSFSSSDPKEGDIFSTILSKMVNESFSIKISKSGKVIAASGLESMISNIFEDLPEAPAAQINQIKAQFEKSYGLQAIKNNTEAATAIFPEKAVKVGDRWEKTRTAVTEFKADITTEYELIELTDEYALIKGTSSIDTKNADQFTESNGMQMKFSMNGSMDSQLKIDPNSGWIISANMTQKMKGNAEVQGTPQMPEGMNIPMNITTKIEVSE